MAALDLLTPEERQFVALYKRASANMSRAARLTFLYLVGAGIFVVVAITSNNPWWSLVVFASFAVYAALRVVRGRQLVIVMSAILAKYEHRIEELERRAENAAG